MKHDRQSTTAGTWNCVKSVREDSRSVISFLRCLHWSPPQCFQSACYTAPKLWGDDRRSPAEEKESILQHGLNVKQQSQEQTKELNQKKRRFRSIAHLGFLSALAALFSELLHLLLELFSFTVAFFYYFHKFLSFLVDFVILPEYNTLENQSGSQSFHPIRTLK